MNRNEPSSSAAAQNGSSAGSDRSRPGTLVEISAPRMPSWEWAILSWSAASSGCCRATVARPTRRSGFSATAAAMCSLATATMSLASGASAQ